MTTKITIDQIQLSNERVYNVVPLKVKYMLLNVYNDYMNIKKLGFVRLMGFSDGNDVVTRFLTASFDSEKLAKEVLPELLAKDMTKILEITQRINELQEEPEIKNAPTPQTKA